MKKILIFVLSGAYNLGDELILRSEIDLFQKYFPEAEFTIATYDENSFFGSKKNIEFISFFPNNIKKKFFQNIWYFFRTAYAVATTDLVIVGGGGIFFDNEPGISFQKNLLEWKIRLFWARIFRKKVLFLGISVEVKQEENQKKLAKIFHKNDKIFPRDERSTKILQKFWIPAETLYDSVFLMPPQQWKFPDKPKKIGISLRGGFWNEVHISEFKKFLQYVSEKNFEIIFLSHAFSGESSHHDVKFVEENFWSHYTITKSMQETYEAYKTIDAVISMRLHATILASQRGIPVLMIPYWPKTVSLAEILGLEKNMIDISDFHEAQFEDKFKYLYDNYKNLQEEISASYKEIHTKFLQKIEKTGIIR